MNRIDPTAVAGQTARRSNGRSGYQAIIACLLTCLAGSFGTANAAAPNPVEVLNGNYYHVELIVFTRRNTNEANTSEALTSDTKWQQPSNLSAFKSFDGNADYPFSLEPKTRRMLQQSRASLGSVTPPLRPALPGANALVSQVRTEMGMASAAASSPSAGTIERTPELATPGPTVEELQADLDAAIANYEAELNEGSYRFRSRELQYLTEVAGHVRRGTRYQVLLAGSWHQPVPARNAGEQLLIQTGTRTGDLFQLEGSVGVTLGRYLHLDIDLWYYEPELGAYTELLPAVLQPAAAEQSDANTPGLNADSVPHTLPSIITAVDGTAVEPVESIELEAPSYRLVVPTGDYFMHLSESRRMRSAELHYLDHPKLGVLVRIDPMPLSETVLSAYEALRSSQQ